MGIDKALVDHKVALLFSEFPPNMARRWFPAAAACRAVATATPQRVVLGVAALVVVACGVLLLLRPFRQHLITRSPWTTIITTTTQSVFVEHGLTMPADRLQALVHTLTNGTHTARNRTAACKHMHMHARSQAQSSLPTPLQHALTAYAEHHAAATGDRAALVEDLLRAVVTMASAKHRYLYVDLSASGLGNRLNTVISAFLYALLTHRVLLLSTPEFDWDDLFCQPFPGGDWVWPAAVQWENMTAWQRDHNYGHRLLAVAGADWAALEKLITEELPSYDLEAPIIKYWGA